jgi:putrescine transport system substrate-binding protein
MNKKNYLVVIILLVFIPGFLYLFNTSRLGQESHEDVLNIYTWLDFIPPSLQKKFEDETGIKLNIDYINSDEGLEAKLLTGKSEYDIVYPSTPYVFRHIKLGLYQALNLSKIPNIEYVDRDIIAEFQTTQQTYAVPYLWGTSGFAYDEDSFAKAFPNQVIDTWDYMFAPNKLRQIADKGVASTSSANELFCAVGFWMGHKPGECPEHFIDDAAAAAKEARPFWRVLLSSDAAIDALGLGEVAAAFIWNGDAVAAGKLAANRGKTIKYVVPREGALKWIDSMAIPHNATNVEAAHRFINFLLRPEHMAEVTNFVQFANSSQYSKPFVFKHILENKTLYPDQEIMRRLTLDKRVDPKYERTINRHFFKILVGY